MNKESLFCMNCGGDIPSDYGAIKLVPNTPEHIILCEKCMPYYLKQEKLLNEWAKKSYSDLYINFTSQKRSLSASELIAKSGGTNLAEGRRFKDE